MEIELIHILQSKYGIIFAAAGLAMLLAVVLSAWVANFWQQAHATLAGKLADVAKMLQPLVKDRDPGDVLFPGVGITGLRYAVEHDAADLGIATFSPHDLRHTFISNLARAGIHPKTVQELAGHSNIETTMRYYTHMLRGDRELAIERAHGAVWGEAEAKMKGIA